MDINERDLGIFYNLLDLKGYSKRNVQEETIYLNLKNKLKIKPDNQ